MLEPYTINYNTYAAVRGRQNGDVPLTMKTNPAASVLIGLLLSGAAGAAFAQTGPISTAPAAPAAPADPRDAKLEALQAQVEILAAQLADLKAQTVAEIRGVRDSAAKAPAAVIANGKPGIASADGKFTANFHVVTQLDAATYSQRSAGPIATDLRRSGPALGSSAANVDLTHARDLKDGDVFRRARFGVDGTAFGDWDYRILFDFGGSGVENTGQVYETWIQYSGLKPFKFRVGAFSPSLGLDDQASTSSMPFLERAAVTDLSRGLAAGDTRTAAQVFAGGDHWLASAAVTGRTIGVATTGTVVSFTSAGTSTAPVTAAIATAQSYDDQLGFTGRFAATPIHGLDYLVHVGVNGSYVENPPNTTGPAATGLTPVNAEVIGLSQTQEVRVDGTKLINTGNINARHAGTLGLEFAAQKKNLLLQAEYTNFHVDRSDGVSSPDFHGYYVSGGWILTGERRTYNAQSGAFDAVPVSHPFNLKDGGLGAWELAARYSDINLNYQPGAGGAAPGAAAIRGGKETNWTVGLNWYPNGITRFMLDYANVKIDRLSPNAANFQTPAGAQIGQTYNVVSGRAQFAF
jgi:phosphate-selective porin OprO/OprP